MRLRCAFRFVVESFKSPNLQALSGLENAGDQADETASG